MTSNQIAYNQHLETQRSNKAREQETKRHNLAAEDLGIANLRELERSNLSNEDLKRLTANLNYSSAVEGLRSNEKVQAAHDSTSLFNTASTNQSAYDRLIKQLASNEYVAEINNDAALRRLLEQLETQSLNQLSANEATIEAAKQRANAGIVGSGINGALSLLDLILRYTGG